MLPFRERDLLALGRTLQIGDAGDAAGHCLATTLTLAVRARALGLDVELVKWQVRGDPLFCDHWAVRLDADRVIDPTRVQVDGSRRLVCGIDDYPAAFRRRRCYRASVLLSATAAIPVDPSTGCLEPAFLRQCQRRLLAFDLRRGVAHRSVPFIVTALVEFGRFTVSRALGAVRGACERRLARLEQRLQAIGDGAGPR